MPCPFSFLSHHVRHASKKLSVLLFFLGKTMKEAEFLLILCKLKLKENPQAPGADTAKHY
jgi:hypothetical protein